MKKLFLLTLILFSLFSSQVFAAEQQTKVTATIDYVYYDNQDQSYYMNTLSDVAGGSWTLEIIKSDKEERDVLKALNEAFKGKQILIVYSGSLDNNDEIEIEIVSSELVTVIR